MTGRLAVLARISVALSAAMLLAIAPQIGAQQFRKAELQALSPKFWDLFNKNAVITQVATGFGFTEGPVWDESGYLWVSDETLNAIYKINLKTGSKAKVIALGDPDGSTYDKERRILTCASVLRAIIRLSPDGSKYTVVADHYKGRRLNSPNDLVLGPDGAIYFTDPTSDLPKGDKQEIPFKGVYRIAKDGKLSLLTEEVKDPNGLAFSPDGKHLYVDDSTELKIWSFDFHRDGTLTAGRIFGIEGADAKDGVPDGMKVDTQGNLYVVGPRGIWVWSPSGEHLGSIVVPEQPANLTWGDADYSTLYITAGTSVYKISTRAHGFVPYL